MTRGSAHSGSAPDPADAAAHMEVSGGIPALRLQGVSKQLGTLQANDNVDLTVGEGEIHALLGENGAGKTTLMNLTFGLLQPDSGTLELAGVPMPWATPREAISRGIGMVHQHLMLVPTLTVAENLLLHLISTPAGRRLTLKEITGATRSLAEQYGLAVDAQALIEDLSVGERLRVEIIKTLLQGEILQKLRLLILDEPTGLLTPQEVERLFEVMRQLALQGVGVVLITHKLDEVMEVTDTVTVLRGGRRVFNGATTTTSTGALAEAMVGKRIIRERSLEEADPGAAVLTLDRVSLHEGEHRTLDEVSLTVRSGEIMGVAGVAGNGQTQLEQVATGLRQPDRGTVELNGRPTAGRSRRELLGEIAHIPQDRQRNGLAVTLPLGDNLLLGRHQDQAFQRRGVLDRARIDAHDEDLVDRFAIKVVDSGLPIAHLSGGNQQRVVLARELSKNAPTIVASQPTRGLDVAAQQYVHELLRTQRDEGAGILLVSFDLDEILLLSDRIAVMSGGRIVGILNAGQANSERLGLMMSGSSG